MAKMTLKAARVNAGYTQKASAKELGVSNKTLGDWENGRAYPKVDKVEALCSLYGVTYDDLIFLTSNSL